MAKVQQSEGELVVFGENGRVVDAAPSVARRELTSHARRGYGSEHVDAEHRRGAGDDEALPVQPIDVSGVARVFIALQMADESAACAAAEHAAHPPYPFRR